MEEDEAGVMRKKRGESEIVVVKSGALVRHRV
jgi:hypothetical protein